MSKKLFYICIIVFILFTIVENISIATSNNYVSIRKEKIDDLDGIKVIINVSGTENSILGMQGTLEYDKSKLEMIEAKVTRDDLSLTAFNQENGKFLIEITDEGFFDKNKQIKNEDVLEVFFKTNTNSRIVLKDVKLVDSQNNMIECDDITLKLSNNWFVLITTLSIILIISLVVIIKKKNK